MAGGRTLTCARDGTSTQLTCTQCGTPICPQCLVRTDVGLRCLSCSAGANAPTAGSRGFNRRLLIGGVVVVAVLVGAVGLATRGGGGSGGSASGAGGGGPQHIDRPDLGFALDLPAEWIVDIDQTPGSVFFAHAAPPRASARIFRGETAQPLDQNVANVVGELRQQGAHDFAQQAIQVGDLPGIKLDYVAADGPGGAQATHSSYRVKKGDVVISLSLATTDAVADNQVLAGIASSFRLL